MWKNYLIVALRNFWRNKTFESKRDRIYRVVGQNFEDGKTGYMI